MSKRLRKTADHSAALHGYPRPQLVREQWISLDGDWRFGIDAEGLIESPEQIKLDQTIVVPFAPETPASGVEQAGFFNACWYQREFEAPKLTADERLILRFEAVDYRATVWVNGKLAMQH
jgi:beta-galactosidase/beta-glucuronidase